MTVQPVIMRGKQLFETFEKNGDEISFATENYKRKKN
jgi:hypothetical protein